MTAARLVSIEVPDAGMVSGLWLRPDDARALVVLGHGAGAGMRHTFMEALAEALAAEKLATLRYQFPYMERERRAPDRAPRLVATVRAAVEYAAERAGDLPLFAGGKSMGGRMTSTATAQAPLRDVRGLVLFGFPLHPPGRPSVTRGEHLADVRLPMLFLQGTRDRLATLDLLRDTLDGILPTPILHVLHEADHGFHVTKRSGRTDDDVIRELAATTTAWTRAVSVTG